MSDFWIEGGETMLFIGDSITDCGRRGADAPLGSGYVSLFAELATARHPERAIHYINKGIDGNKVSDLVERWREDVLFHEPDRLSIKIGINDLHSHLRGVAGIVCRALRRGVGGDPTRAGVPGGVADAFLHFARPVGADIAKPGAGIAAALYRDG